MGAGQSIQTNLWSSTFEFQSKNNKLGLIRLNDKQTEDSYICRKLSLLDKKLIQEIDRLIDIKLSIQSPYVVKLQKATSQKNQQYCAYGKNYYLLFKQPYQTLKQQTLNRKFKNSLYTENQLQMMLEIGVKGLFFLKNIDHPHQNVSSTAFFINQNRSMILGDPFMFSRENQPPKVRNGFTYPSPQLIKYQNHEIEGYNKHLSDLFTFGLVLLEVFYMSNMDSVYQRYFQRVNYDVINKKLSGFKNIQLRKKLFILLDPQPKNREMIFKYFIKSIPATDLFNKLSKQKFKKTIDRYNLAISEVTEWKNDATLENRLTSSEGKKTFSVSTNQNPSHQQKIYSPLNKNTLQNIVQTKITEQKTINQNKYLNSGEYLPQRHKSINQPYRTNFNKLQQSPLNVFQRPFTSFETLNQPYKAPQVSFSSQYQNYSQINPNQYSFKPLQKINFSLQSPINYFQNSLQTQSYSQGIVNKPYEKNYFRSDLIQQRSKDYSFKSKDNLGTFQQNHPYLPIQSNNKYPSSLLNQSQQKSNQSKNSNNQKGRTQQTNNKQIQYNLTNSPIQSTLKLQKNNNPNQIHQIQNLTQVNQNKCLSQVTESFQKDSVTPAKQKSKRISLDYGRYHHLSTINQRSEMTESFISQTHQKKSDILIQEDQQNIEILRDCQSQKQKADHSFIDQNKVWSITYPSGTKYMGEVKNDKRNGLGTFFYIDGSKYHGHWLDNKMNGFGTLYYPNGKIAYEGQWKMDNFHGKGKVYNDQIGIFTENYHYQDCSDIDNFWLEYDGELFEDRKEGKGTLKLANGEYFQAQFQNDELHGHCKFFSRQNKIIEGLWKNNKLVKIISQRQKP